MVLPDNKDLYLPVLRFFSDKKAHSKIEIYDETVTYFDLTEEDLNQTVKNSNIFKFERKFNLVLSYLVKFNCLVRKGKDVYVISSKGLELLEFNSTEVINEYIKKQMFKKSDDNLMKIVIHDFGAIYESDIDIKKINVIGGQNATGKSTASKLLYCFLKYNTNNRQKEAYESIVPQIINLFRMVRRLVPYRDVNYMDFIKSNYRNPMFEDVYDILEKYEKLKDIVFSENFNNFDLRNRSKERIFEEIREIDNFIDVIEEDGDFLFNLIMNESYESEFPKTNGHYAEFSGLFEGNSFKFISNYDNEYQFHQEGSLLINEVLYIDSFSSLDIDVGLINTIHVQSLLNSIGESYGSANDLFDPMKNSIVEILLKHIREIINGRFIYENGELKYVDESGVACNMSNTASGIKQIGIIQLLLENRKLKENSFLIIDEPEVNLHPEWQIHLAGILCMLTSYLNIHVYINTHSPIIIEAMGVYSEYYELLDDTNFYLTQKHPEGGFYFKKIAYKNLGVIYQNLAAPYEIIDKIKAQMSKRI